MASLKRDISGLPMDLWLDNNRIASEVSSSAPSAPHRPLRETTIS